MNVIRRYLLVCVVQGVPRRLQCILQHYNISRVPGEGGVEDVTDVASLDT